MHGFQFLPNDADLRPAEMHDYFSTTDANTKDEVETTLLDELASGNYIISGTKPHIVSALGAVPKPGFEELQLIHGCYMPSGLGVNSYIEIENKNFRPLMRLSPSSSQGITWLRWICVMPIYQYQFIQLIIQL